MDPNLSEHEAKQLENSSKDETSMSVTAQLSLREYAGRTWPAESHKARITRLARALRWGHRRTRSIYNGEPVALRADEFAAVQTLTEAKHEYRDLQARIARLEAVLLHQDEDFHSPQVAAYRQGLRAGR